MEEQRRREGDEARNLQAAQGIARMSLGTSLPPPAAPSPAAPPPPPRPHPSGSHHQAPPPPPGGSYPPAYGVRCCCRFDTPSIPAQPSQPQPLRS